MNYNQEQITVAINATSVKCFVRHVLGLEFSEAVKVAMLLSHEQNGQLSQDDKDLITGAMPIGEYGHRP